MQEKKRFEAKSVDMALQEACAYFGLKEEDLQVEVIDQGSSGIFGLGGRSSIIEALPRSDSPQLKSLIQSTVSRLLEPIINQAEIEVRLNSKRAYVYITDQDHSGLIIGKDGQTIAALEYLTNRIVSKNWPDKLYVQVDAGGYRKKQDSSVRRMAFALAEKAKKTGKVQSTKPLSSYHRRIVHMALQNDASVQTKSKGEGSFKRVLIQMKKANK